MRGKKADTKFGLAAIYQPRGIDDRLRLFIRSISAIPKNPLKNRNVAAA